YGVGLRMKLSYTRGMGNAALEGELYSVDTFSDDFFGLNITLHMSRVFAEVVVARTTWEDKEAYDEIATVFAVKFHENFTKFTHASEAIQNAGPVYRPE